MKILWNTTTGFTGLCDRLRALASLAAVAEVLDAEEIIVRWWPNQACPYGFHELFHSSLFTPFVYDTELDEVMEIKDLQVVDHPLNWSPTAFQNAYSHLYKPAFRFQAAWAKALTKIFDGAYVLEDVVRWSKGLEGRKMAGIHLRRTDAVGTHKMAHPDVHSADDALWKAVEVQFEQHPDTLFVLASDDAGYYASWTKRLVDRGMLVTSFPKAFSTGLRQTDGQSVVADVLCLSLCQVIFGSTSSSVLQLAAGLNSRPSIRQV